MAQTALDPKMQAYQKAYEQYLQLRKAYEQCMQDYNNPRPAPTASYPQQYYAQYMQQQQTYQQQEYIRQQQEYIRQQQEYYRQQQARYAAQPIPAAPPAPNPQMPPMPAPAQAAPKVSRGWWKRFRKKAILVLCSLAVCATFVLLLRSAYARIDREAENNAFLRSQIASMNAQESNSDLPGGNSVQNVASAQ